MSTTFLAASEIVERIRPNIVTAGTADVRLLRIEIITARVLPVVVVVVEVGEVKVTGHW